MRTLHFPSDTTKKKNITVSALSLNNHNVGKTLNPEQRAVMCSVDAVLKYTRTT